MEFGPLEHEWEETLTCCSCKVCFPRLDDEAEPLEEPEWPRRPRTHEIRCPSCQAQFRIREAEDGSKRAG